MSEQGFIIVTCQYDWLFAKGTIASIAHFMPGIPICLLVDGDLDVKPAQERYGASVIRRTDIPDRWLRQHSFGWGFTKMNAIWHSPFERYVHLDADTIVWGDVMEKVFPEGYDVAWPTATGPGEQPVEEYVNTWFFNGGLISDLMPAFGWRKHVDSFACTGVFGMRRNALGLQDYRLLQGAGVKEPRLFKFGEMGMLNAMVFDAFDKGRIRFTKQDFQVIFPDHPVADLQQRFRFHSGSPLVVAGDEQVLHMPDQKPLVDSATCYSAPMTHFRFEYLRDTEGITGEAALGRLRREDADYHLLRAAFLRRDKRAKVLSLLRGHPGEWRRLVNRITNP